MLLLRNANLYAPEPQGLQHLLIGSNRILWIGIQDPDHIGLPVTVVDLEGRAVIPGFVDGHVHVTGGGGETGYASRVPAPNLSKYTTAGVTSVIGLLGTDDLVRSTAQLVAQIYALRDSGLSAWGYCGGYHVPPVTLTGSVRGDIVLVEPLIGVGELAISDHRSSQPTLQELLRIAADAHVAGLMSGKAGIVHLHLGDGARGLELVSQALSTSEIPARVFQPTHVNRRKALFDEALQLAEQGCHIDVTAFPVEEGEDAWSAAQAVMRYLDKGLPQQRLSVSSDAGGCLPCFDAEGRACGMDVAHSGSMIDALRELLQAGVPMATAVPLFSSNPAELLRLPRKGQLQVGFDADLIVLDEHNHPLHVLALGEFHVRNGEVVRRGRFENDLLNQGQVD